MPLRWWPCAAVSRWLRRDKHIPATARTCMDNDCDVTVMPSAQRIEYAPNVDSVCRTMSFCRPIDEPTRAFEYAGFILE